VSLLAVSLVFYSLGAPFVAALEVIIYAGAVMVLFIFVIMMLNLGRETAQQESLWLTPGVWRGPAVLCGILLLELALFLFKNTESLAAGSGVPPKAVGIALFGPYALAVELASLLLLAGLVGAFHLGRRE
jgi:NADH-quinone oxidoreductase subunit J